MDAIGIILALVTSVFIALRLIRWLGWPTSTQALARWGVALIAPVLLLPLVPVAIQEIAATVPDLPAVSVLALIVLVSLIPLTIVGYFAFERDTANRLKQIHNRLAPRRRGLPPSPGHLDGTHRGRPGNRRP